VGQFRNDVSTQFCDFSFALRKVPLTPVTVITHSAAKLLFYQQFHCGVGDLLSLDAHKKQIPRAKNARWMTVSGWDSGSGGLSN